MPMRQIAVHERCGIGNDAMVLRRAQPCNVPAGKCPFTDQSSACGASCDGFSVEACHISWL